MIKKILLFAIFLAIFDLVNAQALKFGWANVCDASNGSISGKNIRVGKDKNTYSVGYFTGTVVFKSGNNSYRITSNGANDIFVMKTDPNGKIIWVNSFGAVDDEPLPSFVLDDSSNIYITSWFLGQMDVNPGPKKHILTSKNSGSFYDADAFILKLNNKGDFIWAKQFGGSKANIHSYDIGIDKQGDVYSTGYFTGTVNFNPDTTIKNQLTAKTVIEAYLLKLDKHGNYIWVKGLGGNWGMSIATDKKGNIFTGGYYEKKVDLDPGSNIEYSTSKGLYDIFITKLDSNGNYIWSSSFGSKADEQNLQSLILNLDGEENLYITAEFHDTIDFGNGLAKLTKPGACIVKIDTKGDMLWAKSLNGNISPMDLLLDDSAYIYSVGSFDTKVDFNPGSDSFNIQSLSPDSDCFLSVLDSSGNFVLAKAFGGNSYDGIFGVDIDDYRNIYFIGAFNSDSINLSPGFPTKYFNKSGYTTFINKLLRCEDSKSTITETVCGQYISPSGKYTWNTSGTYYDTIHNISGCDSFITFNITILSNSSITISHTSCDSNYKSPSGKYFWNKPGFYSDTFQNSNGCDSLIFISLSFGKKSYDSLIITSCNSYTAPSGKILTTSDIYYDTIPNQAGCDSIIEINLTILKSTSSTEKISACNSYTSPSGKYTWTQDGTYYDTILNQAGCDSFMTIHLKLLDTYSAISETACNEYISPSGKTWNTSNIYYDTIPNQAGCDSVIEINLTILKRTFSLENITACKSYASPSGKYIWTKSGMYADTMQNQAGCDSVIGINLVINNADVSVTQSGFTLTSNATNSNYQWLDCNQNFAIISGENAQQFIATINGDYAVSVTQNNCTDTSICYTVTNAGINPKPNFKYSIYPNPSNGMITIEVSENSDMKVYDGIGKLVYETENINQKSQHDLSSLASGVYYIQLSNNKGIITENIVIGK